ncbi:hypothetical protein A2U01_0060395, partial [Trifolium medium]|nr:hypothetical protein [Trifolium medium]
NSSRVRKAFRGSRRGWCKLVELPKNPMVVGGKIFMRVEDILSDEGMVDQHGGWWEVGITINFKGKVEIVGNCL